MDPSLPQRPPPSYNQAVALNPPVVIQAGRTISGSDTDVSTSAENLTHEEKYVLSHTERQDPQGEENLVKSALVGGDFSAPAGAIEWAKSVEKALKRPMGPPTGRPPPQYPRAGPVAPLGPPAGPAGPLGPPSVPASVAELPYNSLERLLSQRPGAHMPELMMLNGKDVKPVSAVAMNPGMNGVATSTSGGTMSDKSNSSSSSHLAAADSGVSSGGPGSVYEGAAQMALPAGAAARLEKSPLSRSQPSDLNRNGTDPLRAAGQYRDPPDYVAANANEMMQILMLENSTLKQEIDMYARKVQKLQKFANELSKLQSAYDDLVVTCQRREQLEYMARQKLTAEVRRASDLNNSLSSRLDSSKLDEGKKQPDRRELLIQQLVSQNKELQAVKERQEIELTAQRATLQEQRQYIDILDTALTKAQENVVRIEKEHSERIQTQFVDRATFVHRVEQLQRALTSQQLAADRRETAHKKIRADLEKEIHELKSGKQSDGNGNASQTELADTRQKLREAHERVLLLETELAHCQQKLVESSRDNEAMQLMERSITHLEPSTIQLAGGNPALEERVLGLEAQLVEKDAMIRALQKHALEMPTASVLRGPHSRQSSLQSLAALNTSFGLGQHGYSSSAYSSTPVRPPGSTNAGSMVNVNRLQTVTSAPLTSAEPRHAVSMATLNADISLLNASLASTSLMSAPVTMVTPSSSGASLTAGAGATVGGAPSGADSGASILQALQKDREVFPEHYWQV